MEELGLEIWRCFFPTVNYATMKTPKFIDQNMYETEVGPCRTLQRTVAALPIRMRVH